ncbi:MAG: RNA methyltransferase [Salibacteraceae bacterium]
MNRKLSNEELGRPSVDEARDAVKLPLVVVLDNVRSLANVGSIFRTCDGFGVAELYLTGITGTPPHREINKTALGATESVKWSQYVDATELVKRLIREGYEVYSVEQAVDSIALHQWKTKTMTKPLCLVFGNEVNGVDQSIIDLSNGVLEIPQQGMKHSLNVSVAAGIILWEAYKALTD